MKRIKFRTAASADMRNVARDTTARWGEAQARAYVARLRDEIKALTEFPERFPQFEPRAGMRRMNCGRHAVFYLVLAEQIEIIRVLHVASDFERWL